MTTFEPESEVIPLDNKEVTNKIKIKQMTKQTKIILSAVLLIALIVGSNAFFNKYRLQSPLRNPIVERVEHEAVQNAPEAPKAIETVQTTPEVINSSPSLK